MCPVPTMGGSVYLSLERCREPRIGSALIFWEWHFDSLCSHMWTEAKQSTEERESTVKLSFTSTFFSLTHRIRPPELYPTPSSLAPARPGYNTDSLLLCCSV